MKKIYLFMLISILTLSNTVITSAANANTLAKNELSAIFNLYDEFDYSENNWELMKDTYEEGLDSISAASQDEAYTALNDAAEKLIAIQAKSKIVTACISVENLVTEKGFIIFPEYVKIPKYTSVASAVTKIIENKNPKLRDSYLYSGTLENDFELTGVYQGIESTIEDEPEVNTPDYLVKHIGKYMTEPNDKSYLKSGDYTSDSCFVFSVNNKFPNVKASAIPVVNEDVIRMQFSVYGNGADVGAAKYDSETPLITPADKGELFNALAELNLKYDIELLITNESNKTNFEKALIVAELVDAAQKSVDKAIDKIEAITPVASTPDSDTATDSDEVTEESNAFPDVNSEHFAKDAIEHFASIEILNGRPDGNFAPDDNVTRGEFATILARLEKSVSTRDLPFTDVKAKDWYAAGVSFCYANGITNGKTLETFEPNLIISHQEIATMIHRYAKYKKLQLKSSDINTNSEAAEYALEAISILSANEIFSGFEFAPTNNTTRAECAKMLYELLQTE